VLKMLKATGGRGMNVKLEMKTGRADLER
jgi:hypothetical protein